MKRDDTLWKAILEDIFDDFLVFFFKEQASLFDFDRGFEFLDKELEQLFPQGDSTKLVDKLVKVYTKDGDEKWILVHVEVQGYNDADFAKRMFTYFYRIVDRYNKPVTCIAIFTGSNKNFMPSVYNYNFLGTEYTFKYNTYCIIDQDENLLRESDNPFAIVVLTALLALRKGKISEKKLFGLKTELLKNLLQKNIHKNKIRANSYFEVLLPPAANFQAHRGFIFFFFGLTQKRNKKSQGKSRTCGTPQLCRATPPQVQKRTFYFLAC